MYRAAAIQASLSVRTDGSASGADSTTAAWQQQLPATVVSTSAKQVHRRVRCCSCRRSDVLPVPQSS